MASQVKVTCPDCGDQDVSGDGVRLYHRPGEEAQSHAYGFNCPACGLHRIKECTPAIRSLLRAAGFRSQSIPAEATETRTGSAITDAEILDLVARMETINDLAALAADPGQAA